MSPTATGTIVPMPHMGVSVEEGTVVSWNVSVGDTVAEGDVLCEIATDKVDMEVESPASGTVTAIIAEADATVPVGEAICELDGSGIPESIVTISSARSRSPSSSARRRRAL